MYNFYLHFFIVPDLSNVEKIDDDGLNDREKRLREIKEKYANERKIFYYLIF